MNKKMLGICLAAAVISTGTLGGVVASEVADRSLLAANANQDVEHFSVSTTDDMFTEGNVAYLAVSSDSIWWIDGANTFLYFYENGDGARSAWSSKMTLVENFVHPYNGFNSAVYEVVVPDGSNDGRWDGCVAARISLSSETPSFGGGVCYNQTTDIVASGNTFNTVVIWNTKTDAKSNWGSDLIEPYDRLVVWGDSAAWWRTTANHTSVCQADGSTNWGDLKSEWNKSAASFANLGNDVKAYFSNFDVDGSYGSAGGAYDCSMLARQYDYIVGKYNGILVPGKLLDNFARR